MRVRARRTVRVAIGGALALTVLVGMGALTRFPYRARGSEGAELRLAWRARAPRVEECRRLTPEEQAALPVHMRREEVCEGRLASYRLVVTVDGRTVRRSRVRAAGARGDRPLHVYATIPLEPGRHAVEVTFERADGSTPPVALEGDHGEARVPDRLAWSGTLDLGRGEVALLTYRPELRADRLLRIRAPEDR